MSEPGLTSDNTAATRHTFVLKLTDRPGAMELIAATFAHRGISLTMTLGNDGTQDSAGHATVLVHFHSTPARKEAVKATLSRLSRVVSLCEYGADAPDVRQTALIRLTPGSPTPQASGVFVEPVQTLSSAPSDCPPEIAHENGPVFVLLGSPQAVSALLNTLRQNGALVSATQTVLAL